MSLHSLDEESTVSCNPCRLCNKIPENPGNHRTFRHYRGISRKRRRERFRHQTTGLQVKKSPPQQDKKRKTPQKRCPIGITPLPTDPAKPRRRPHFTENKTPSLPFFLAQLFHQDSTPKNSNRTAEKRARTDHKSMPFSFFSKRQSAHSMLTILS